MSSDYSLHPHHLKKVQARGFDDEQIARYCTQNGRPAIFSSVTAEEVQRDWLDDFPLLGLEENAHISGMLIHFCDGTISFKPDELVWNPKEKNWSKYLYAKRPPGKPKGFNTQPWIPPEPPKIITEGMFDGLAATDLMDTPCAAATAPSHIKYHELPDSIDTYVGDADQFAHHSFSLLPVVVGQCLAKSLKIAHLPRNPNADYAYTGDKIPEDCKWGMEEWAREWKRQGLDPKKELQKVIDNAKHPYEYLRSVILEYGEIGIRYPLHTTQITVVARAISDATMRADGTPRRDQRQVLCALLQEVTKTPKNWTNDQIKRRDDARFREQEEAQGQTSNQEDSQDHTGLNDADFDPYEVTGGRPIDVHLSNMLVACDVKYGSAASSLYSYDDDSGFWSRIPQSDALQMIQAHAEKAFTLDRNGRPTYGYGSTQQVRSSLEALVIKANNSKLARPTPCIPFLDQTYDCKTEQPTPHSADHGATYGLTAPLVLTADCPKTFLDFVHTCYGEESLQVIRAWIRAIVDPTIPYGKFLLIIGIPGTGKGILLEFLDSLLPAECRAELLEPGEIANPDKVYQFVLGRRYIAFHDLPARLKPMQLFYKLVENVGVSARKLNASDSTPINPNCRFSAAAAKMPTVSDANDGIIRRSIVLKTLARHGKQNRNLKASIVGTTEAHDQLRAEVLGWALSMPKQDVIDTLYGDACSELLDGNTAEMEEGADAVAHFVDQCLTPVDYEVCDKDWQRLFDAFCSYCDAKGFKGTGNQFSFQGRIRAKLPHLYRPRGKESTTQMREAGRTKRANVSSKDWGYKLISGAFTPDTYGRLRVDSDMLSSGQHYALKNHHPTCPPDAHDAPLTTPRQNSDAPEQSSTDATADALSQGSSSIEEKEIKRASNTTHATSFSISRNPSASDPETTRQNDPLDFTPADFDF